MSNFKNIKKLGLSITTWGGDPRTSAVLAEDLEALLQSAQMVYGYPEHPFFTGWNGMDKFPNKNPSHQALLICVEPYKKQTKAEAALELLEKLAKDHDQLIQPEWHVKEAKRILNMKV